MIAFEKIGQALYEYWLLAHIPKTLQDPPWAELDPCLQEMWTAMAKKAVDLAQLDIR